MKLATLAALVFAVALVGTGCASKPHATLPVQAQGQFASADSAHDATGWTVRPISDRP